MSLDRYTVPSKMVLHLKPVNKALSEISGASKIKTGRDGGYFSSNEINEALFLGSFIFSGIMFW
jgi:hypothetical protein